MTALDRYVRLESGGVWREAPDAQRKDVVVSFGDATLVIADRAGRPLSHWSLPAIRRQNPNQRPAVFSPDEDAAEALEIAEDTMIDAIEEVRRALAKSQPRPGKLRHWITGTLIVATVLLAIFWLPGALMRQTLAVVPAAKRAEIGATILGYMQGQTGAACTAPEAMAVSKKLSDRLFGDTARISIVVLPELARGSLAIPGRIVLLDQGVLRGSDDPAVVAGHIVASRAVGNSVDPLEDVLRKSGMRATFSLLTTGELPTDALAAYGQMAANSAWIDPEPEALRASFLAARIPVGPYAALVNTELEEFAQDTEDYPIILEDADWVSFQNICER